MAERGGFEPPTPF